MIAFLGLIFAMVFPLVIGLLVISALAGKKLVLPFLERLALSYLAGAALLTFSLFLFSLAGVKFYFIYIFLFWAAILVLLAFYLMRKKVSLLIFDTLPFKKVAFFEWVLIALIAFKVFYLYFQALAYPVYTFDALWNWFLRGKVFFFARIIPLSAEAAPRLGGGMVQYPLQIPLLETWIAVCMQYWSDFWVKIIFPTFFVSMGVIFYYGLKHYASRVYALFFTFLLTAMPLLLYHGTVAYADMVVGAYFLGAGIYLWRWIMEGELPFLLISALLAVGGAWVKAEGLIFYGIALFTLILYSCFQKTDLRARLKNIGYYLSFLVPYLVFWLGFKKWQGLGLGNISFKAKAIGSAFIFKPGVLGKVFNETFFTASHGLLFALLVLVVIFLARDILFSDKKYLLLMPLLGWGFFIFLYVCTQANYEMVFSRIIQHRNYITFTPLLLYSLGYIFWDGYLERKKL